LNGSCYDCKYNGIPRLADITLGDFWGVERFHPEMDDNMGTSVILVNNTKGESLFNQIKNQITFHKSELNKTISRNPCILKSYPTSMHRDSFFKDLDSLSLENILEKYKIKK
jgi:coenzyme F420-reducing hydrogenase beta subunit